MEYLVTFHTHFDAVKYSRNMKKAGYNASLKPVPRKLSSSCGSCVVLVASGQLGSEELDQIFNDEVERLYQVTSGTSGDDFVLLRENS